MVRVHYCDGSDSRSYCHETAYRSVAKSVTLSRLTVTVAQIYESNPPEFELPNSIGNISAKSIKTPHKPT